LFPIFLEAKETSISYDYSHIPIIPKKNIRPKLLQEKNMTKFRNGSDRYFEVKWRCRSCGLLIERSTPYCRFGIRGIYCIPCGEDIITPKGVVK